MTGNYGQLPSLLFTRSRPSVWQSVRLSVNQPCPSSTHLSLSPRIDFSLSDPAFSPYFPEQFLWGSS